MTTRFSSRTLALLGMGLLLLGACQPASDSAYDAANASKNGIEQTADKWRELFTFRAKNTTPQLPQTRYCYHTQSDVVCYDSPQNDMTSSLVGFQDGGSSSWFQPGGGSVGASGSAPTMAYNAAPVQSVVVATVPTTNTTGSSGADCMPGAVNNPFYCSESPYVKGAVSASDIPSIPN